MQNLTHFFMNSIFTKRYKYGKFPNLSKVEEDRKVYFKKKLDSPYLCIDSYEDGLTVSFTLNPIEYSFDKKEWHTLNVGETTPEVNAGSPIYFKGECRPGIAYGIGTFSISKRCGVSGNVLSLMFGDDFEYISSLEGYKYAFTKLFDKCRTIETVDENLLSAKVLANDCYSYMFNECTNLKNAPKLDADVLAENCYNHMFTNCISLQECPRLLNMNLKINCYLSMFEGCTSLTSCCELPATTLASSCYQNMFKGCTSITHTPILHATKLASKCYMSMFANCKSLIDSTNLPATELASSCYDNMFNGCENLEYGPHLHATSLQAYCYRYMFQGCTKLKSAFILPAKTLNMYCYYHMFYNCNNINYITMLATDVTADHCMENWLFGVSATGTFVKDQNVEIERGPNGIPTNWEVKDYIEGTDIDAYHNAWSIG